MPTEQAPRRGPQGREEADPFERTQPMPLVAAAVTLAMVVWGVSYILLTESFGPAAYGDQRTIADLRGVAAKPGQVADGKQVYTAQCVACHQASGQGLPGVFPPLDGSEWVSGDERILANILLHGVSGQIVVKGTTYSGAMPPFAQLSDAELAAVASHIRSTWSNKAPPLDAALFEKERKAAKRTAPFASGDELKALATKTQ